TRAAFSSRLARRRLMSGGGTVSRGGRPLAPRPLPPRGERRARRRGDGRAAYGGESAPVWAARPAVRADSPSCLRAGRGFGVGGVLYVPRLVAACSAGGTVALHRRAFQGRSDG